MRAWRVDSAAGEAGVGQPELLQKETKGTKRLSAAAATAAGGDTAEGLQKRTTVTKGLPGDLRCWVGVWMLAVNWEVVRWYVARLGDGGDEPWGLAALVAAVLLTPRAVWRARIPNTAGAVAVGLAVGAVVGGGILPMLVRGGLLAMALGVVIAGGGGAAGRAGLLALSLPWVASVQFYAGYPLRVVTAELGRPLLALAGVATERVGVVLAWSGGEVIVDAPCSGVRMLWTGLVVACGLAAWRKLGAGRTVVVVCLAAAGVIGANALRAAVLFLTESGVWPNAAWVHEAVGAVVFGGLLSGLWKIAEGGNGARAGASTTQAGTRTRVERGVSRRVVIAGVVAGVFLAGWALEREARQAGPWTRADGLAEGFPGWPEFFEGRPLQPLARSEQARVFARGFPGETAVFGQAGRVVVLRWIREASRGVHPAADCYRARGYAVEEGGLVKDAAGGRWSEFVALRGDERWRVRERWRDERGNFWTDVSAWWWAAQAANARGPWWAETVAVRE